MINYPKIPNCNSLESILSFWNYPWTINMAYIIAHHQVRLVNGEGILFNSPNEKILTKLNWWYEKFKVKEKLAKLEIQESIIGRCCFGLMETQSGDIDLFVSTPAFLSRIAKINESEQSADIWLTVDQSDNQLITRLLCTKDSIIIEKYPANKVVVVGGAVGEVDSSVKPVHRFMFRNKLNQVPFWEMINKPHPLFTGNSTTLNAYPTMYTCYKLQLDLEDSFQIKSKERWANRTHWYGILSDDLMQQYRQGTFNAQDIFDDVFIGSGFASYDKGGSTPLQVVQGNPSGNLEAYTYDQKSIIRQIYDACHFSYDDRQESNYQNKTASLITKTKDLEEQSNLQSIRREYYNKLFDCVLQFYGLWNGEGERPYSWDFLDCGLIDQLRENEIINARLENGTMEPVRAISIYDKVNEKQAQAYWNKIKLHLQEQMQTELEMQTSYSNDDENDSQEKSNIESKVKD